MYPYNYVTSTQAKKLAEQVESGSYTSGLMFGVQWDLLLKFIEEKTVTKTNDANKKSVKEKIEKELNNDSTNIGNYNNNLSNITNTNEKFSLINIYDIAGNVWEWTLENTADNNYPYAIRGGNYGDSYQANYHGGNHSPNGKCDIGFRISLY